MNQEQLTTLLTASNNDPVRILQLLNGYYECPKTPEGKRLGYLVGYAGKYNTGSEFKQYVGDVYINVALAEQFPVLMHHFALELKKLLPKEFLDSIDVFAGPQMGGIAFAEMLAFVCEKELAYIEKKVTEVGTEKEREKTRLALLRHSIVSGKRVCIVEDVLNNFSTTYEMIGLLKRTGIKTVGIVGLFNRSPNIDTIYPYQDFYDTYPECYNMIDIPIHALVRKAFPEYKQENEAVSEDIAKGNFVPKPKDEWQKLMNAMNQVAAT